MVFTSACVDDTVKIKSRTSYPTNRNHITSALFKGFATSATCRHAEYIAIEPDLVRSSWGRIQSLIPEFGVYVQVLEMASNNNVEKRKAESESEEDVQRRSDSDDDTEKLSMYSHAYYGNHLVS